MASYTYNTSFSSGKWLQQTSSFIAVSQDLCAVFVWHGSESPGFVCQSVTKCSEFLRKRSPGWVAVVCNIIMEKFG